MVKAGLGLGSEQRGKTPPPPPGGGQIGKSGVKIADFDAPYFDPRIGSKSVKAAENFRPVAGHKTVKVGSAEIGSKSVKARVGGTLLSLLGCFVIKYMYS